VRRIAVIGPGGSGKSRLARRLSEATGIPVVELDHLFWRPGWVETPLREWEEIQRRELSAESWIVDGLHQSTMHLWLDAADTVIFLDISPLVCIWRVTRRRLDSNGASEPPPGCEPAPFHRALAKFLLYQWEYRSGIRWKILAILERRRRDASIVILRSARETEAFLQSVAAGADHGNLA
jgi:adenylate kinase family enzyme